MQKFKFAENIGTKSQVPLHLLKTLLGLPKRQPVTESIKQGNASKWVERQAVSLFAGAAFDAQG